MVCITGHWRPDAHSSTAIPVFIASDRKWADKFQNAGLPIIGDDIKSLVGATIVHRTLTQMIIDRGARINSTCN